MNNTFCLAIFLLLIYFKNLAWEFSAETISILFIEVRGGNAKLHPETMTRRMCFWCFGTRVGQSVCRVKGREKITSFFRTWYFAAAIQESKDRLSSVKNVVIVFSDLSLKFSSALTAHVAELAKFKRNNDRE